MKPFQNLLIPVVSLLLMGGGAIWAADEKNLCPEGAFEMGYTAQGPDGFEAATLEDGKKFPLINPGNHKGLGLNWSLEEEEGSKFLRFINPDNQKAIWLHAQVTLPQEPPSSVRIGARIRLKDPQKGTGADWYSAQIDWKFRDAEHQHIKASASKLRFTQEIAEWTEKEQNVTVPAGARYLILEVGLFNTSGTFDVDDLVVIVP